MSRLSIEITPEQHQRLKAMAALSGQTIKAYILERTLPPLPEHEALSEQEAPAAIGSVPEAAPSRKPHAARAGTSVEQIFANVRHELRP